MRVKSSSASRRRENSVAQPLRGAHPCAHSPYESTGALMLGAESDWGFFAFRDDRSYARDAGILIEMGFQSEYLEVAA